MNLRRQQLVKLRYECKIVLYVTIVKEKYQLMIEMKERKVHCTVFTFLQLNQWQIDIFRHEIGKV